MRVIRPQPGPQTDFLESSADIAVYGGAAGGGKTYALLLEPLRYIELKGFGGAIFRRTMEQVRNEGGLWDESLELYSLVGGRPIKSRLTWKFPSGATIRFGHLQFEKDKTNYQGAQFAFIGFDELTHFSESQFFYLLSRNRSTCGIRPYVRATTNPDANSWVKRFLAPWVDGSFGEPASSSEVRCFKRDGEQILWVSRVEPDCKSLSFVRASLSDNRILMDQDPGYLANLKALQIVDRRRLLDGDWEIVEGGNMFRREWFEVLAAAPRCERLCRFWDLAATRAAPGKDPDWTAGVLVGRTASGTFVVIDVQRVRSRPAGVEVLVKQTADLDRTTFGNVSTRMEQEPGSSGVASLDRYLRFLAGFDFRGVRSTGSKADRARPLSAQAEAGNVVLVAGSWNLDFLNELCSFPTPEAHDDQVDAASGALAWLASSAPFGAVYGGNKLDIKLI